MKTVVTKGFLSALVLGAVAYTGCVSDRPSRNGVFNENQYVRKDFLIQSRPVTAKDTTGKDVTTQVDDGWVLKTTITDVSSPNPFGDLGMFVIFPGSQADAKIVKFRVTQDRLQMINTRELSSLPSDGRIEEVINAWPVTNVDLKYRVNLDGEKTNFYEENQELDWQVRQWVKLNFSKNDFSDISPFPSYAQFNLAKCADTTAASATLVPNSFRADTHENYMQWKVSVTLPVDFTDATCAEAFGQMGEQALRIGRNNVTFNIMYSMMRAKPSDQLTYVPLEVDEHDPIRHKYGPLEQLNVGRDPVTGQKTGRLLVNRFDPNRPSNDPVVWYFAENFPQKYKDFFLGDNGMKKQTNDLLAAAGATLRIDFRDPDDGMPKGEKREFGDVRYNYLRWLSDRDFQAGFAGVLQHHADPRTGEVLSASIEFNDFEITELYALRIDSYLKSVGASADFIAGNWPEVKGCKVGTTMPVVARDDDPTKPSIETKNISSPLFGKIQQYLNKPVAVWGNLGPKNFIQGQDDDFFRAYFPLAAYSIFADPDMNQFVTREGGAGVYGPGEMWNLLKNEQQFHALAAKIDRGEDPYADSSGPDGVKNALAFINNWRSLRDSHRTFQLAKNSLKMAQTLDDPSAFSFESVIARDARHCIADASGTHMETRDEWVQNLIDTYWQQVAWHEFGHAMGLAHNFMGSVDRTNFPKYKDADGKEHYGLYSSSVMEYNSAPDRIFAQPGWAPYDQAAISWIYANGQKPGVTPDFSKRSNNISGQASPTEPWVDPKGFNGTDAMGKPAEVSFLFCSHQHLKFTPLCRQGDLGTTPSEIVANELENYEWTYRWRNYRSYRKFWNNSAYANSPTGFIIDMRRWLALWAYDWSSSEIADTLRRIGIDDPNAADPDRQDYFAQLTNKFRSEASAAGQLIGAFHKAVINQSAGERPYASIYDRYFGDQQQQGIILDKLIAMEGWVGLWQTDNYDPNQAGGHIASFGGLGDDRYDSLAEDVALSMVGGSYDVYPYFIPTAVALFAQDTHRNEFSGRVELRDWVGGFSFSRIEDFLNFFKQKAIDAGVCDKAAGIAGCTYDVRTAGNGANELVGPDKIAYIWTYVPDRNRWVVARKDRNIASYKILFNYNDDILRQKDDGTYGAYTLLRPVKYMLDSFESFN